MTDAALIRLYQQRSEGAIAATEKQYGAYCRTIAYRILGNEEDTEECLSDVWMKVWNAIPPEEPEHLKGWLAVVTRNCALTHCRQRQRQPEQVEEAAAELAMYLTDSAAEAVEAKTLGEAISRFLMTQKESNRRAFLRRYWYGDTVEETAERMHWTTGKTKTVLFRMRSALRDYLQKEDFYHG